MPNFPTAKPPDFEIMFRSQRLFTHFLAVFLEIEQAFAMVIIDG